MDTKALVDSMISVAKAALPLIVPGAAPAIALGERVVEMIDQASEHFSSSGADVDMEMAELMTHRDAIEQQVNAHVDETIEHLRGE